MRKLLYFVVVGCCLLSISRGHESYSMPTAANSSECNVSDRYGSCSATCGTSKAICEPGRLEVLETNQLGNPKRTREHPPSCRCAGPLAGAENCSISDQYGSCSAGGAQGKAICKPGRLEVVDINQFGNPLRTKEHPPECYFSGRGGGAENCGVSDRYGSCSVSCERSNAICKPGYTEVLDINKYGN